MKICVYGASSTEIAKEYVDTVEDFGEKLANRGHSIVYGGGAKGLMGAAARGVRKGKGRVIGVAPSFFNVDGVLFSDCTEMIRTDGMRQRKQVMEDRSDAFVALPGGVGTFDELFEIMTLRQLGRHNKPIVIFNIKGYYDAFVNMIEVAIKEKFMIENSRKLFFVSDNAEEILNYLENYVPTDDFSLLKKVT